MKKGPPIIKPAELTPQEVINYFCHTYTVTEVKCELWKWMVLSNKSTYLTREFVQTDEFAAFYDKLNELLTAIYKLDKA